MLHDIRASIREKPRGDRGVLDSLTGLAYIAVMQRMSASTTTTTIPGFREVFGARL